MEDPIPSCNIQVDKEGVWYYQGAEIVRTEILELFYHGLEMDESGRYVIRMGDEICSLEVEDTPWIVREVDFVPSTGKARSFFQVRLSDGSVEELDLSELRVGDGNVLYCRIKEGRFHARFSRPAYYAFSNYVRFDEERNLYFVPLDDEKFVIR